MAKLHFKYGVMSSGKSLSLISTNYNYTSRGMNTLIMKPIVDTREGSECVVRSRTGAEVEAYWVYEHNNLFKKVSTYIETTKTPLHAVLIDEVQFLTVEQINQLQQIVMELNIPVLCYGLKTDFQGNLFPAVAKLLAICDDVEATRTVCWCGRLARQNARVCDGKVIKVGEIVDIGGNDKYIALCNKHFYNNQLSE